MDNKRHLLFDQLREIVTNLKPIKRADIKSATLDDKTEFANNLSSPSPASSGSNTIENMTNSHVEHESMSNDVFSPPFDVPSRKTVNLSKAIPLKWYKSDPPYPAVECEFQDHHSSKLENPSMGSVSSAGDSAVKSCECDCRVSANPTVQDVLRKLKGVLKSHEKERRLQRMKISLLNEENDDIISNVVRLVFMTHRDFKELRQRLASLEEKVSLQSVQIKQMEDRLTSLETSLLRCIKNTGKNSRELEKLTNEWNVLDQRLGKTEGKSDNYNGDLNDQLRNKRTSKCYEEIEGKEEDGRGIGRKSLSNFPYRNAEIYVRYAGDDGLPVDRRSNEQRFLLSNENEPLYKSEKLLSSRVLVGPIEYYDGFYLDRRLIGEIKFFYDDEEVTAYVDDTVRYNWIGVDLYEQLKDKGLIVQTRVKTSGFFDHFWWFVNRKVTSVTEVVFILYVYDRNDFVEMRIPAMVMESQKARKTTQRAIYWDDAQLKNKLFLGNIWIQMHKPTINSKQDTVAIYIGKNKFAEVPGKFIEIIDRIPSSMFGNHPAFDMKTRDFFKIE